MATDSTAPADFVRLFTDGACSGNPGPGGWAYILEHPASGQVRDASGAEPNTTNNRMELTGVIEGLASLNAPARSSWSPTASMSARASPSGCPSGKPRAGSARRGTGSSP